MSPTFLGLEIGSWSSWVSGLLTAGSLGLGFYILNRTRRADERKHASGMICWLMEAQTIDPNGNFQHVIRIHNAGDQTLLAPRVHITRRRKDVVAAEIGERMFEQAVSRLEGDYEEKTEILEFNSDTHQNKPIRMAFWPDEKGRYVLDTVLPTAFFEFDVSFRDGAGFKWSRNPRDANLTLVGRPGKR